LIYDHLRVNKPMARFKLLLYFCKQFVAH